MMPDMKPFVQQDNVIRLSPLTKVVAGNAASVGSQGGAASAGSYNTDAGASYPKGGSTGNPRLDALAAAARSGDGNAMSMLEALGWTLGVGGALVAGGAVAYNALKKGKPAAQMDPASVKSAGTLLELPKPQEQKLLPAPKTGFVATPGAAYTPNPREGQKLLPSPNYPNQTPTGPVPEQVVTDSEKGYQEISKLKAARAAAKRLRIK